MKYVLFILLFPLFSFSQTITLTDADVDAFYGAVGHGQDTEGFRSGTPTVYQVTSTGTSSITPGTLAYALAQTGPRYIIFRVGGTIEYTATDAILQIGNDDYYVAGQTAPGDGIAIKGVNLEINSDDAVWRHVRVRLNTNNTDDDCFQIGKNGTPVNNIYLDHVSMSYGTDENVGITDVTNATIANCIISDPQNGDRTMLFQNNSTDVTIYRNLMIWSIFRNPRSSESQARFEFINNVVYGYSKGVPDFTGAGNVSYSNWIDVEGNHYLEDYYNDSNQIFKLGPGDSPLVGTIADTKLFFKDNLYGQAESTATYETGATGFDQGTVSTTTPFLSSGITATAASGIKEIVIGDGGVGAYNGLSQGLDSYDNGLLTDVLNAETDGYATSLTFPTLASGTPYADSDGDGLGDEFEVVNGGSISPNTRPATATLVDGTIIDQSGVTNYATTGYTYMDIFLGELAGDWGNATGGTGGGSSTPDAKKNATSAMLISH
ncbi:MAG: hypothetical protein KJO86_03450 [Muriicola sp.]|nr:hypothetical protein [Muriicola sp.]